MRGAHLAPLVAVLALACGSRTQLLVDETSGASAADAATPQNDGATPTIPYRTISVSWDHACALTSAGNVACWGATSTGAVVPLTHGIPPYLPPTIVPGVTNVVEVGTGRIASCALDGAGATMCWGNAVGASARKVALPTGRRLVVGDETACVITPSAQLVCVGEDFGTNGCGGPFVVPSFDAGYVVPLDHVADAALGNSSGCALRDDGSAWCWGCNPYGALGGPATTSSVVPARVSGIDAVHIAAKTGAVCVLGRDGVATCWGDGSQFGTSPTVAPMTPRTVPFASNTTSIDVGVVFSCAAGGDDVTCIGALYDFETGCNRHDVGNDVFHVRGISELSVGYEEVCAKNADGVSCWGCNTTGILGAGPGPGSATPRKIALP